MLSENACAGATTVVVVLDVEVVVGVVDVVGVV